MGYDRRFHLSAAANSTKSWASLDTTLWNLAFTGYAKVARCKHCFCLTRASSECEWATDAAETGTSPPQLSTYSNATAAKQYRWICRKWNNTPGRCPVPVCLNCAYDTTIYKSHKVIQALRGEPSRARDSIRMHPDYFPKLLPCLALSGWRWLLGQK